MSSGSPSPDVDSDSSTDENDVPRDPRWQQLLDIFVPMFSGGRDEYGCEEGLPLPLSFSEINNGFPSTSNFPLLKLLPTELANQILDYLPSGDLKALALVDKDCCQLARARLFSFMWLDCSRGCIHMLRKLKREHESGVTRHTLGACVRRLKVSTDPQCITRRFSVGLYDREAFMSSLSPEEKVQYKKIERERERAACTFYFERYQPLVAYVIGNALPNLEALNVEERNLNEDLMGAVASSPVRQVRLFRTQVPENCELRSPRWRLQKLHIEILWELGSIMPFVTQILRGCQDTLEELTWSLTFAHASKELFSRPFGEERLRFQALRSLHLTSCSSVDVTILDTFISSQLHTLCLSMAPVKFYEHLARHGKMPALRIFSWGQPRPDEDTCAALLSFIRANRQIDSIAPDHAQPVGFLGDLLSVISIPSMRMTHLHLSWASKEIPRQHLLAIRNMPTLRKLWLSAGNQFGWRYNWYVDHAELLKTLEPLKKLEFLAFDRDTYQVVNDWLNDEEEEEEEEDDDDDDDDDGGDDDAEETEYMDEDGGVDGSTHENADEGANGDTNKDADGGVAAMESLAAEDYYEASTDDYYANADGGVPGDAGAAGGSDVDSEEDNDSRSHKSHTYQTYILPPVPPVVGDPTVNVDQTDSHDDSLAYYSGHSFPNDGPPYQCFLSLADNVPQEPSFDLIGTNMEEWIRLTELRRRAAWENWHAKRMLEIATRYGQTFPALRYMFVGQRPISINEHGETRLATEERNSCWTFLRKTFKLSTD